MKKLFSASDWFKKLFSANAWFKSGAKRGQKESKAYVFRQRFGLKCGKLMVQIIVVFALNHKFAAAATLKPIKWQTTTNLRFSSLITC
ncbi:hypothetical protein [Paenibacillus taihuensis]|uniref:hypothetical protein n=1 Tax=Paenibacillus taihuensis TaxID=1156355 RepID=UPI000E223E92|nr:hypothetical protein [Paenibacillus taihuensis]